MRNSPLFWVYEREVNEGEIPRPNSVDENHDVLDKLYTVYLHNTPTVILLMRGSPSFPELEYTWRDSINYHSKMAIAWHIPQIERRREKP